jgi:CRP-like cAMP-binding protein
MNELIEDLRQTKLFLGIEPHEIEGLLDCLCTKRVDYAKGDYIIEEGSKVYDFGIILSGHGRAIKWDPSGRLIIITLLKKGSEIGVILAASLDHRSPVTVQAQDDVSVLQIPFERVLTRCEKACPCHDKLLRNYINIVAEKGLVLHERIDCLLRPTVREKILAYLLRVSHEQQKSIFTIPMNRNAMAEYLNVERSALSRELSNMKRDGLIDYHKNSFRLFCCGEASL